MTKDQVAEILNRVFTWPPERQAEIARVVEPHAAADDVLRAVAGFGENCEEILDGLSRLHGDIAGDEFSIDHGHLAGNIEPAISFDGARKRKMLAAGSFAAFNAVSLDTHGVLP